jgi:hypothetical protein
MEQIKAKAILLEGFKHTPNTRTDFFESKLKESNCSLPVFCEALIDAYEALEMRIEISELYLSSSGPGSDDTNIPYIEVPDLTIDGYKFIRFLTKKRIDVTDTENKLNFLEDLLPVLENIKNRALNQSTPSVHEVNKPTAHLSTTMTIEQRCALFDLLIQYQLIPDTTDKEGFVWSHGKPMKEFQPIKWDGPKHAIRELYTPILGHIGNPEERLIEKLFLDRKGIPLKMYDPGKDENSARCLDIEKIIKSLGLEKKPTISKHL